MRPATCLLLSLASLPFTVGCGAVFPRHTTTYQPVTASVRESGRLTRPTESVQRITFREAEVAPHREDGSNWDSDGPPDLYAVLSRDGTEIYRTPVIHDGVHPIWNNAAVTLHVTPQSHLLVELWDDDGPFDDIVGRQEFLGIPPESLNGEWLVSLQGGASLMMSVAPPDAQLGLGVTFSVHDDYLGVLEVVAEGPAARAGLQVGDHITAISGRSVADLGEQGSQDAMDRGATNPLDLLLARGSGAPTLIHTHVNAVYPAR